MSDQTIEPAPLGSARTCPEISCNGKVWKLGYPTRTARGILEDLVAAQAVSEVLALKRELSPGEYKEMFDGVRQGISAGEYRTWGPGWLQCVAGNGMLFPLSLLRLNHPDMTMADLDAIISEKADEFMLAVDRVMQRFFEVLVDHPKIPRPSRAKLMAMLMETWQRLRTPTPEETTPEA